MHESIDNRIVELKEICFQIMNILDSKKEMGVLDIAYNYLKVIVNGEVQSRSKYYGVSLSVAYYTQLLYILSNLAKWRDKEAKHYKALLKEYQAYFQGKQNTGKLNESVNPLWQMIRGIGD